MEKKNNLIIAQAFIMLCTLALPFISLYCQERSPLSAEQRAAQRSPRKRTVRRRFTTKKVAEPKQEQPSEAIETQPTQDSIPAQDNLMPDEENAEPTEITSDTKQVQANITASHSWYSKFAPLLLGALYKSSETGISAFTKTLIKLFIVRRDALADKEKLETDIALLSTKEISYLRKEDEMFDKEISKLMASQEIEKLKLEEKASLSSIVATGAFMAMLNTAVPMMGLLMGTAVKIGLQMLVPADNS